MGNAFTIKVIWCVVAIKTIFSAAVIVNKSTATIVIMWWT